MILPLHTLRAYATEAVQQAMEQKAKRERKAEERKSNLRHCRFWSFHQQGFMSYEDWIKETWDGDREERQV